MNFLVDSSNVYPVPKLYFVVLVNQSYPVVSLFSCSENFSLYLYPTYAGSQYLPLYCEFPIVTDVPVSDVDFPE